MQKVFVSDAIGQERLIFGSVQAEIDPGWKALAVTYKAGLAACEVEVETVIRPEIYQTSVAQRLVGVRPGDWHLAVKPVEHIRPFHGIPNVFVCNWGYRELLSGSHPASPFFDQVRLLSQAKAVVCCTGALTRILQQAGVAQAFTLPPYIPARDLPERRVRSGRQLFLTTAGIGLSRAVEGFLQAWALQDDLHLIVSTTQTDVVRAAVTRALGHDIAASAVSFDATGFEALLPKTDFFLAATPTQALDLAMVRAMHAGVPVVAAADSLLDHDAAIFFETRRVSIDPADEPLAYHLPLDADLAVVESLRDAVAVAASLDDSRKTSMRTAAQSFAKQRFGLDAFKTGLSEIRSMLQS